MGQVSDEPEYKNHIPCCSITKSSAEVRNMNNITYNNHFAKYVSPKRYFESKEKGEDGLPITTVILDKNGQICGGTFAISHKGRPVKIEQGSILCPVTCWNDAMTQRIFSHYEILIANVK